MTSNQFDTIARGAVAVVCANQYGEEYSPGDIQLVWFAHVLGNKKAILIDNGRNNRIYEVTYNIAKDELYVDAYEKTSNSVVHDINGMLYVDTED